MKKSILITGASSGIWKHSAEVLAQRGWIVWAGYRLSKDKIHLSKIHKNIRPIKVDVVNSADILLAQKEIEESKIPLVAIFNNAWVALWWPLELLNLEEIKKLYDVNIFGIINVIQVFLPLLRKYKWRIVNMGSISWAIPMPFIVPYASSKAALRSISDALWRELLSQNIKVSIIEPASIKTPIREKSEDWSNKSIHKKSSVLKYYSVFFDRFTKMLADEKRSFIPIENVGKAIIHAVESKIPKKHYQLYSNNFLLNFLIKTMPSMIMNLMFNRLFKKD